MTREEMWAAFILENPEAASEECDAWAYGSDAADELAMLTANGIKTATASAYPLYELEEEPIPLAGGYNMILKTDGSPVCITKTTRVSIVAYKDVSEHHAYCEGEGDRSLAYWQRVHSAFFTEEMASAGLVFTEEMPVVCEEFEVVFK